MSDSPQLGEIQFTGKDMPSQSCKYDRLAIDVKDRVMLLSVVAESQVVKAIRAILNGGAKADINAAKGRVINPDESWSYAHNPGRCFATEDSYEFHSQKLEYGLVHALFVTRMPGFMPTCSTESLWRELSDVRFTTPIIRAWLPYIEKKLRDQKLLMTCESYNFPHPSGRKDAEGNDIPEVMRCGVLTATTADLDNIVSTGLRDYEITVPSPPRSNLDPAEIGVQA